MKYRHIDELYGEFRKKRRQIRTRLKDFRHVPSEMYFYELIYCLMTPQSAAVNAAQAQRRFEELDFLHTEIDPMPILFDKRHYIRFHRTKSLRIIDMKRRYDGIKTMVMSDLGAAAKRDWLVENVKGLSLKEATHFLRNIGMNDGLAILDRHILKNLRYHGVLRHIPSSLTNKRYRAIEKKFHAFSAQISITTDELDLLFWSREAGTILK